MSSKKKVKPVQAWAEVINGVIYMYGIREEPSETVPDAYIPIVIMLESDYRELKAQAKKGKVQK